jgi:Protein of unknown function (DUF3667)
MKLPHRQIRTLTQNSFAAMLAYTITAMMNLEIEPAADLATGAMVANVVEQEPGRAAEVGTSACLNCGAQVDGAFCKNCGQKAKVHRTLSAFWHDLIHSVFHFDGKVWRTLPLLAFKPGQLTRRYVHGERARFVSPLALFLFSVFLMFATFGQFGVPIAPNVETKRNGIVLERADIAREIATNRVRLARAEAERAAAVTAKQPTDKIDVKIKALQTELSDLQIGYDMSDGIDAADIIKIDASDRVKEAKSESKGNKQGNDSDDAWSDIFLVKIDKALQNPKLLLYKLQSNAYKFSWLLIPLSLPFLWLIFAWRREYEVYDHIVFITYALSFMTLLLSVAALGVALSGMSPMNMQILLFLPVLHMFVQLKGAYLLSNRAALWRTAAMLVAAVIVLIIFSLILLALGVAG